MVRLKYLSPKMKQLLLKHIDYQCRGYSTKGHEPMRTFWRQTMEAANNNFDFTEEQLAMIYTSRIGAGILFAPWDGIIRKIGDILRETGWTRNWRRWIPPEMSSANSLG